MLQSAALPTSEGQCEAMWTQETSDELLDATDINKPGGEAVNIDVDDYLSGEWTEESAIKAGLANLKDGREYDRLYEAALCRQKADWLVGINFSRLYTCLYNNNLSVERSDPHCEPDSGATALYRELCAKALFCPDRRFWRF